MMSPSGLPPPFNQLGGATPFGGQLLTRCEAAVDVEELQQVDDGGSPMQFCGRGAVRTPPNCRSASPLAMNADSKQIGGGPGESGL